MGKLVSKLRYDNPCLGTCSKRSQIEKKGVEAARKSNAVLKERIERNSKLKKRQATEKKQNYFLSKIEEIEKQQLSIMSSVAGASSPGRSEMLYNMRMDRSRGNQLKRSLKFGYSLVANDAISMTEEEGDGSGEGVSGLKHGASVDLRPKIEISQFVENDNNLKVLKGNSGVEKEEKVKKMGVEGEEIDGDGRNSVMKRLEKLGDIQKNDELKLVGKVQQAEKHSKDVIKKEIVESEVVKPEIDTSKKKEEKTVIRKKINKWQYKTTIMRSRDRLDASNRFGEAKINTSLPQIKKGKIVSKSPKRKSPEQNQPNSEKIAAPETPTNPSNPPKLVQKLSSDLNFLDQELAVNKSLESEINQSLLDTTLSTSIKDSFVAEQLKSLDNTNLEKMVEEYSNLDRNENAIFDLIQILSKKDFNSAFLRKIDFTYLRKSLHVNKYDVQVTADNIISEMERRDLYLSKLSHEDLKFDDEAIFVFGVDIDKNLTIGINVANLIEKYTPGDASGLQNDPESQPGSPEINFQKSDSEPIFRRIYLFMHALIDLNLSIMRSQMKLNNKLCFVLDYHSAAYNSTLIRFLMDLNHSAYPGIVKSVYLINIDIEALLSDQGERGYLKQLKGLVFVLPEDYDEPIFKRIQRVTVSSEYGGDLAGVNLFNISDLLRNSLCLKYEEVLEGMQPVEEEGLEE